MLNLFISYSRNDALETAIDLRERLTRVGYTLWRDLNDMRGSLEWRKQLRGAIAGSDAVLLLLTPQALLSQAVQFEWDEALLTDKLIYPLLILPCRPPDALKNIHYHNLHDPALLGYESLIRDLRELEKRVQPSTGQSNQSKYHVGEAKNSAIGDSATVDNTGGRSGRPDRPINSRQTNSSYRVDKTDRSAVGEDAYVMNTPQAGSLAAQFSEQSNRVLITQIERLLSERDKQLLADLLPMVQAEHEKLNDELDALYVRLARRLRHMQTLPQLNTAHPEVAQQVDATIEAIDRPQLSGRHRLKIALPIVPKLVWFESEVEVGQSSDMLKLWDEFLAYWGQHRATG